MSDLTFLEKRVLENYLDMGGGYVLDFSNSTFAAFVADSIQVDADHPKYNDRGSSKANRLRSLWLHESNHRVGKLVGDLLDYAASLDTREPRLEQLEKCRRIADRLRQGASVESLSSIQPNSEEPGFEELAGSVRAAIEANQPESGLDRLHTFVTKYLRNLNAACGLETPKDRPLHSLMGQYVRRLKELGLLQASMTERILKSSISTLEAFNGVRNNQSFAHDNPTLNYEESLFIFSNVTSTVRFLDVVEQRRKETEPNDEDLPF